MRLMSRLCYLLRHDLTMLYAESAHMSTIAACDEQQSMDLDICSHISQPSSAPGQDSTRWSWAARSARGLGGSVGSGVSACWGCETTKPSLGSPCRHGFSPVRRS